METIPGTSKIIVGFGRRDTVTIDNFPWHSYDFDFASLNFTMRHLVNPEKPFAVDVADVVLDGNRLRFADKGSVDVMYQTDETRHGTRCRKYIVNGPGLENRGGFLWVSKEGGYFVDYEIDLPDENAFKNGKLRLQSVEKMDREAWDTLMLELP